MKCKAGENLKKKGEINRGEAWSDDNRILYPA